MSGDKKSKRRRRDRDRADDDDGIARGSGVNYGKVADRHVDDDRFEKHRKASSTPSAADATPAPASTDTSAGQPKVSSQMAAVMRVMAGMEERTIAQKLADSNRPTWEQYKKDNEDKLDIEGVDKKKMEAYRKELDEQREKLLTKGTNHRKEGKEDRKSKKKKKRKHRRHDDSSASDSSIDYSSDDGRKSHKRKKHKKRSSKHDRKRSSRRYDSDSYSSDDGRKKSSKHKKKKDKKRRRGDDDGSSSGNSYRLSSFFTKGSDDESK